MHSQSTTAILRRADIDNIEKVTALFWASIHKTDDCWFWTKAKNKWGYGYISCRVGGKRRMLRAHRFAYLLTAEQIPEGMFVLHNCDIKYAPGDVTYRACCRPGHVRIGTAAENSADMVAKDRAATGDRNPSRLHPDSVIRGERHHSHLHPENLPHGNEHWTHTHPDKIARGDKNGMRLHPDRAPRGDRNGARLHPESRRRGMSNPRATLTDAQVLDIRERRGAGTSLSVLAAEYGINTSTVSKIARRAIWAHLP